MRRGFTLIEMSVVLLIIAIVTHLAMRQLATRLDDKKTSAANRQLAEIRDSIYALDSEGTPTGFLADMGRLVSATNGTLAELWQMPAGARPYAVLPARKENFAKDVSDTLRNKLEEPNVYVPTGWRGPYLRLPVGKRRLMDAWGNALENPDAAGYDRIALLDRRWAAGVSHFGPTALTNDVRRQRVALAPAGWSATRLFVKVVSRGGEGYAGGTVSYKWFGPRDGLITGGVTNGVPYGATAAFAGLTPGVRVVWDSLSGVSRLVTVRPGDNLVQIEIP